MKFQKLIEHLVEIQKEIELFLKTILKSFYITKWRVLISLKIMKKK
jgi:hypothetical protein